MEASYTLADCPRNADATITNIDLDERHRFRLLELGLRVGTDLRVTQHGSFGGRVIARGAERIALDGGTARRIHIRTEARA